MLKLEIGELKSGHIHYRCLRVRDLKAALEHLIASFPDCPASQEPHYPGLAPMLVFHYRGLVRFYEDPIREVKENA
jgi:hypothetical protein